MTSNRPENTAPPEIYYNEQMAERYATNSRMIEIQGAMSRRCIELLNIPQDSGPQLLLDLGCGSGLSGAAISEAGHVWVGLDISEAMLRVAARRGKGDGEGDDDEEGEWSGDLILRDLGSGVPFRPGTFDGAISVSAVQWLCNSDAASHNPVRRLRRFFETLFACLKRSARAILQVYPETPQQMELITSSAMRAGFTGGLLVDFPNSTKAKKFYLTLFAGPPPPQYVAPKALGEGEGDEQSAVFVVDRDGAAAGAPSSSRNTRSSSRGSKRKKPTKGSREWILQKKEFQRKLGNEVRPDTKYTGRKRRRGF